MTSLPPNALLAEIRGGMDQNSWLLILGAVMLLVGIFVMIVFFSFVRLWIQSLLTGAKIGIMDLVGMKLRNVDYPMIVRQKIALVQAGVLIRTEELESHFLVARQRAENRDRGDRGAQGRHGSALEDSGRHRPGRPRHPRRGPHLA